MRNPTDSGNRENENGNGILVVLGTRPEAIKLAPVVTALRARPDAPPVRVAVTGQHRQLAAPVLEFFGIVPDFDLDIMRENQSPEQVVRRTIESLEPLLQGNRFGLLMVQGDTASAVGAALAGFYRRLPVAHVEAGLRTGRRDDPFPEEMNRRLITQLASIHFAPTERNRQALLDEGVPESAAYVTGNTVIDALGAITAQTEGMPPHEELKTIEGKKAILLTTHRRENLGEPQRRIFRAVNMLLERNPEIAVLFPVHPNPNVRAAVRAHLLSDPRLRLLDPLDYIEFVRLMKSSFLILTDSGGIQEEAPALGVPALVLRETTEREEGLAAASTRLIGTETDTIVAEVERLLADGEAYERMARPAFPFGTGDAAGRIADILLGVSQSRTAPTPDR